MYNPSEAGKKGSIFGLPYSVTEAKLVLLPVHLDVTVSYHEGTSKAPDLILRESTQLDLSIPSIQNPWELSIALAERIVKASKNEIHRGRALNVIESLEHSKKPEADQLRYVNEFCESVHDQVEQTACSHFAEGKIVGVIGGDHSSPLGLMRALAKMQSFGILQIDAHMDLRKAYEGFTYSHASIMFNALQEEGVSSLTQVGIRDFCEDEEQYIRDSAKKVDVFFDELMYAERIEGVTWKTQCDAVIDTLPERVYISFDMDGLEPSLGPNTGTPVPGGLTFHQAIYLLDLVVKRGKKIIGFDICETGNGIWDANVAARILFRIASLTGLSNGLLHYR